MCTTGTARQDRRRKKRDMFSLRLLCVVAALVARASAVAPGDEEGLCNNLRASGTIPTPDYDPTMRILMDTVNYLNLLPVRSGSVWEQVDNDDNNPTAVTTNVSVDLLLYINFF